MPLVIARLASASRGNPFLFIIQVAQIEAAERLDLARVVVYNIRVIGLSGQGIIMEFQSFRIPQKEKERIREELTQRISKQEEVSFAFIFGSFQDAAGDLPFRDIDIGIFIKELDPKEAVYYALDLSRQLSRSTSFPVDVRIINKAPIPFLFHVIQGKLMVNKDDDLTSNFMENVIRRYLDMKPLLHIAAKEAFAS